MVTTAAGQFLSQREAPELARVGCHLIDDGIELRHPNAGAFCLPSVMTAGPHLRARVWGDAVDALEHPPGSAWFSRVLGREARLVHMPPRAVRPVNPRYGAGTDQVSFADGFPSLLLSEASLQALNARLDEPVAMSRFRPNIVVSGCQPFAEDTWQRFAIGQVTFRNVKPCGRCKVTTLNPATGTFGAEPLRTLANFRRGPRNEVLFGVNVCHDSDGAIRTGTTVQVLRQQGSPLESRAL